MEYSKIIRNCSALMGMGVLASVLMLPQAHAELVLEQNIGQQQASPGTAAKVDDREALRGALKSSEKAQATLQAEQPATAPAPAQVQQVPAPAPVAVAPVAVAPAPVAAVAPAPMADISVGPATEIQNLSKAELMRRERVRTELENEDILQERLEELRLRDEKRRTDELLGALPAGAAPAAAAATPAPAPTGTGLQQEVVVSPVTDHPGEVAPAPVLQAPVVAPAPTGAADSVTVSQAAALNGTSDSRTNFVVSPRAGVSMMTGSTTYTIQPRYAGGIGLGLSVSDNLSIEGGYTFSEYGVTLASTNPFVSSYQAWAYSMGNTSASTIALKQNVGDLGLKLHFLGPDAKFRPFIGGGGAYSKSYLNYDQSILDYLNSTGLGTYGSDYEMSSYLGYLSTGFDIRVTKNVSFGALVKYYTVLSSSENQSINNYAFYSQYGNPYGTAAYGLSAADTDKQVVGGSLARSSFYSLFAGVSFSF